MSPSEIEENVNKIKELLKSEDFEVVNTGLELARSMERNIVSGLNTLSYVTQDSFSDLNSSLNRELQSIDSSLQTNNLLTGIQ